jgi:DNA repair protein RadA/Sms
MKKSNLYLCRECGSTSAKFYGRCPSCDEWNTLEEQPTAAAVSPTRERIEVRALRDVAEMHDALLATGIGEVDRVLGGGFVSGSSTVMFGEPGVGKSTLALMALQLFADAGHDVLLVAAEESPTQVAKRAKRLGPVPKGLQVVATANADAVAQLLRDQKPTVCVVDSISMMRTAPLAGAGGSTGQVRQAAEVLCAAAKQSGTVLLLVGHVTKENEMAGPRALEHLVDTVLRVDGDRHGTLRLLRAQKHRFGPTGEVGLLQMASNGLRELPDPSNMLRPSLFAAEGTVFSITNDGSRSILVEIQTLLASASGAPKRVAVDVDSQRLAMMIAVLEARCATDCSLSDVYATSTGGLPAAEPAVDLALALAIASNAWGFAVPSSTVVIGEVGLAGTVRSVSGLTRRVKEAARLGFMTVIVPADGELEPVPGVEVVRVRRILDVLTHYAPELAASTEPKNPKSGRIGSPPTMLAG